MTGKAYEPESSYYVSQCMAYDTKASCTFSYPVEYADPECWRLDLVSGEDTGSVCVSRQDYDAYRSGDRYPR
ncbi:hypothetical protein ACFORO_42595 [Amycolatopsis halotolerans]|uniref:Uncharacterized protein n=1 Tax=Amycolatopsis halotolerans TaxID=330083 RepID=A0ABV7QUB9_9PSEU